MDRDSVTHIDSEERKNCVKLREKCTFFDLDPPFLCLKRYRNASVHIPIRGGVSPTKKKKEPLY